MLMLDTEVGAGNQTLASYLPGKHLTQYSVPHPQRNIPLEDIQACEGLHYLYTGLSVSKAYFSLYSLSERATKYHLYKGNAYPIPFGFLDI